MKYALVDGQRAEAAPGLFGVCPVCDGPVIARCGTIRVNHWAHRADGNCDHWWEPETEWHRNWKDHFPALWQEVVHHDKNGERHIADVKTDDGWVIEFQHSRIESVERESREKFYGKIVWIVDGTRRKRDTKEFVTAWHGGRVVVEGLNMRAISAPDDFAVFREWTNSRVPVFFDFSSRHNSCDSQLELIDSSEAGAILDGHLWCLLRVVDGKAYVGPFSKKSFLEFHTPGAVSKGNDFSKLLQTLNDTIAILTQRRNPEAHDLREILLRRTEQTYQRRHRNKRPRL